MLNALQPWHVILIVVAAIVLFGAKKLPTAARGIGQSLRIFKAEMAAGKEEEKPSTPPAPPQQLTDGVQPTTTQPQANPQTHGNVQP